VSGIRPAQLDDLRQVVGLFQRVMPSYSELAAAELEAFFGRVLFDTPVADPDIPSLVYEGGDGRVVGFIAAQVRPMRFDGTRLRLAAGSHLVADPDESRPVGALLLRAFLTGPQDVTVTDTATKTVERIWETLGGRALPLGGIEWIRLLKPGAVAVHLLARRMGARNRTIDLLGSSFDSLVGRPARLLLGPESVDATAEALTPDAVREHLPALTRSLRVVPDYDERYLSWLFTELARLRPDGRTVANLVRADDRVVGWYVYRLQEGALCPVAQIAGTDRVDVVIDHLIGHADEHGASGLRGRVDGALLRPAVERRCILRFTGGRMIHSRDPALADAIGAGDAMLSLLEGEWTALPWPSDPRRASETLDAPLPGTQGKPPPSR